MNARIAGSGVRQALEEWHAQMHARIGDYRPTNPSAPFNPARQLDIALTHIEDVARGRRASRQDRAEGDACASSA
ncbi:hypothetical protein OWR21_10385 [Ralstonia sp. 1B3]